MNPDISFHLYLPNKYVMSVKVSSRSPINNLAAILPESEYVFLSNGMILAPTNTFRQCKINDQSIIIAIPLRAHENAETEVNHWVSAMRSDYDFLRDQILGIMICKTNPESARLHDLRLTRMEQKTRSFRKLCQKYETQISDGGNTRLQPQTTILSNSSLLEPPVEPLPALWETPLYEGQVF